MALRTPISRVRCSAMNVDRATRPSEAMTSARTAQMAMTAPWTSELAYLNSMNWPVKVRIMGRPSPTCFQIRSSPAGVSGVSRPLSLTWRAMENRAVFGPM